MYGWQGRIGHVSPALHDTQALESEWKATVWCGLKSLGIKESVNGYGALLENLSCED